MPQNDQVEGDDFSIESIRKALKLWHDVQGLGEHPLARLKIVDIHRKEIGRGHNPSGLGTALQGVLSRTIESLRPSDGEPIFNDPEWRHYAILQYQFIKRQSSLSLWMRKLHISKSEYYRQQSKALEAVAEKLLQWEDESEDIEYVVKEPAFLAPPMPNDVIIGREILLHDLKSKMFKGSKEATVALQGLPGIGKTAVALDLAYDEEVLARFEDGVLWARLGRNSNVLAELSKWARAVGVTENEFANLPSNDLRSQKIHEKIGLRRMLLIIDDAWQLEDSLYFKIGGPNCARLLTTRSQEIAEDFSDHGVIVVPELAKEEGISLFSQIASLVAESHHDEVSTLVSKVGGIPLGIRTIARSAQKELHAGQDSLVDLVMKLNKTEDLLRLAIPQVPAARHPSLSSDTPLSLFASIGLSVEELEENERIAFLTLSVFPPKPNTFSLAAAVSISASSEFSIRSVVESGLLEHSGEQRYMMHQVINDFAELRLSFINKSLENEEKERVDKSIERHATFYESVLQNVAKLYDEGGQHTFEGLRLFDLEWENIQAGQGWALTNSLHNNLAAQLSLDYLTHSSNAFLVRQFPREYVQWVEQGLIVAHQRNDLVAECILSVLLARYYIHSGEYNSSIENYQRALEISRKLNEPDRESRILGNLGLVYARTGDTLLSKKYSRQQLILARKMGDRQSEGNALTNLGIAYKNLGNLYRSLVLHKESLSIAQEMQDVYGETTTLLDMGNTYYELGDYNQAKKLQEKALNLAREMNDRNNEASALSNLGRVHTAQGGNKKAVELYKQAMAIDKETGHAYGELCSHMDLSEVYIADGKYQQALEEVEQAISIAEKTGDIRSRGFSLFYKALALYGLGEKPQAIKLAKESEKILDYLKDADVKMVREQLKKWQG